MSALSINRCLLCGSEEQAVVDTIPSDLVAKNYVKAFGIDVSSYFQSNPGISLVECGNCGLRYYDPLTPGDAAFYEALQKLPWYYQDIKPEFEFASTRIGATDNVLEIGCGKGVFRSFLPETVNYRGLEFNQAAIDKATAQGLHVTAEPIESHADTHAGTYDVVCHFQVLEHVTDPHGFLEACARAVKPGGKLIIAVPAEDSFLGLHRLDWLNMPPHHVSRWRDKTLRHVVETQLGFDVETIWHDTVADFHDGWYRGIMSNFGIRRFFGGRVDPDAREGLSRRIVAGIDKLGLRGAFARYGKSCFQHAERGHTVCVVGTRPAT